MKVGFIGLGIMGKPMTRNLIKAGHQLVVYDLIPELVAEAKEFGAAQGESGLSIQSGHKLHRV